MNNLHPLANEILTPKFGEPGRCLPLKGSDVLVSIKLRIPIFPQAVTLEHVSKVALFSFYLFEAVHFCLHDAFSLMEVLRNMS